MYAYICACAVCVAHPRIRTCMVLLDEASGKVGSNPPSSQESVEPGTPRAPQMPQFLMEAGVRDRIRGGLAALHNRTRGVSYITLLH